MFLLFGQQVSALECIGAAFGIVGVWLTIRQNMLCFPVGIINVGIYAVIFFEPGSKLYLNVMLQIFYVVILIYGWIRWNKKDESADLPVTSIRSPLGFMLAIICIMSVLLLGYLMRNITDAPLPYWDAATTSMSLIAQWMVARKKIENWLLWILANTIYVWMFIHQSLYPSAILYFIYLILAVKGYFEWRKVLNQKVSGALH